MPHGQPISLWTTLQGGSPCLLSHPATSFFFFFCVFGLHLQHMGVPVRAGEGELQPLAYTTATAMWYPSASATYTTAHSNTGSLTH